MYFSGNPQPLHYSFQRWLGRPLNERQARVISLLEKLRRSRTEEPRLFIHDDHSTPDDNLPALIADYFRWLHSRSRQSKLPKSLIIARSKKAARQIAPDRIFYRGRLSAIIDWRGVDFANLLVVDADRVPLPIIDPLWQNPRSFHQFLQLRCITQVCNPRSVVVIIGNAARWSTQFSLNFFDVATNRSSRYVAYAHQPLPRYLVRRHAARLKPYRPGCNPFRSQILAVKSPRATSVKGATRPLLRSNSLSLQNSASLPAGSAQGSAATASAILPPTTLPAIIPAIRAIPAIPAITPSLADIIPAWLIALFSLYPRARPSPNLNFLTQINFISLEKP